MCENNRAAAAFDRAAAFLPRNLRLMTEVLGDDIKSAAEEIRLRCGMPLTVSTLSGEVPLGRTAVTSEDIETLLEISTGASVYAREETVKRGYVTVRGGHRIGVCGTAVVKGGEIANLRELSSAAVRIAREHRGAANEIFDQTAEESLVIIAPPGIGKTSLLRDLVRLTSDSGQRVSLADERGEVAACVSGRAQMDVGQNTDILTGAPKAQSALMLLKTMNPKVLAMDEITSPEDVRAILAAANCGVRIFATAHAGNVKEFKCRRVYAPLINAGVFDAAVTISIEKGSRVYRREKLC
ncbi:MAG: stage III sporulation protein AB [Oscillospiraceae bacterium]|nr:stage III sporulation protein AB [Oscillospiraceae bacterium]